MALPNTTARILMFMGYSRGVDFNVVDDGGVISIDEWNHADPQPTEQQIIDAGNDLTIINGVTFTVWRDEHGVDPTKTRRRENIDRVDEISVEGVNIRALIETFNKRDNYLTNRIIELQNQMAAIVASTGGAQTIRDAVAGISNSRTETRSKPEAVQDYKNDIAAGNSDT